MTDDIKKILAKLGIRKAGVYDNHFYIIALDDSDEYAKYYTILDKNAVNTEYPSFEKNSNNTTTKVVNYFETTSTGDTYTIFLIADFINDKYTLKIKEA